MFAFAADTVSLIVTASSPNELKFAWFVTYKVLRSLKFPVTLVAFTITLTDVLPSSEFKSVAVALPVTVNVNASDDVAFVNAVFKFPAVSELTVAVTTPLVLLKIPFTFAALVVSLIVTASFPNPLIPVPL